MTVVKASALALAEVPEANSAWLGDVIRQYVSSMQGRRMQLNRHF